MRTAIEAAAIATPKAPRPIRPKGDEPDPAVPPSPVAGAPTGIIVEVVPPGDVEGLVVVVDFGCVVVVTGCVVVVPPAAVVVVVPTAVVVVVGVVAEQDGTVIVLPSSVTAPV